MKTINNIILILFFGLTSGVVLAQDLIERTQLDLPLTAVRSGQSVAYIESQSLKHTGVYQIVEPFELQDQSRTTDVSDYIDGHVELHLSTGMMSRLMESMSDAIDLRIPVGNDENVEIELVEVFPINSEFEGRTSDGKTYTLADYPTRFYRGAVKGDRNSFAAVTMAKGMFRALIGDDFGNYVLSAFEEGGDRHILYNDKKLKVNHDYACGTEDIPFSEEEKKLLENYQLSNNASRASDNCVDIMIEMEEDMYDDWNNTILANFYIFALMNEVATIYNNDDISITLKDVIMWTTSDPYNETDKCDQRDQFADHRQDAYNGRLAHLITSRDLDGGCAYIDELCSTYSFPGDRGPYQFSGSLNNTTVSFPTYSWDVYVVAHEMGHTFGSRHTHACVWNGDDTAIDGCGPAHGYPTEGSCSAPSIPAGGGTIMSYCNLDPVGVNFNLGFGPQPGALIRGKVLLASCTLDCGSSINCPRLIFLDGAVHSDTYYATERIELGGVLFDFSDVNLRCENNFILNRGLEIATGGLLTIDYADCDAAFDGGDSDNNNTQLYPTYSEHNNSNK